MNQELLLNKLKNFVAVNRSHVYIDNVFFRMHYVWTVVLLSVCSILASTKIYIGDPISCLVGPDLKEGAVNQYCYIHSTVARGKFENGSWTYEPVEEPRNHPGLTSDRVNVHTYYPWIWSILLFHAIAFYFPHWAWKMLEGGTTTMLIGNLNVPMLPDEQKMKQNRVILLYLRRNRGYHQRYALYYVLCEVANLINVVLHVILTDYFLDNAFTTYGLQVFYLTSKQPYERDDRLARVFPTVTTCHVGLKGGAIKGMQRDILCILPINILNEKIYIILWFWFVIVLICSIVAVIYRILTIHYSFRVYLIKRKLRVCFQKERAERICRYNNYGEWLLFYRFSQNMDPCAFGDLVGDIDHAIRKWDTVRIPEEECDLNA